ncbi:MAG TPA: hypothetical protein PKW35_04955 [Nannocystaceae bacterium]|nr:hypothetical protein [Nannocystaceae bacterium]
MRRPARPRADRPPAGDRDPGVAGEVEAIAVVYPRADGRLVAASPPAGLPLTIGALVAEASPARAP